MDRQIRFSVVSPVYGCPVAIPELCRRLHSALQVISIDYEIILVEDGSPDDSWERILEECRNDPRVKGIKLSRNFGQHYAITAGLDFARGEWVVVMDCDLQDRPEEISVLYNKALEGYDLVFARRANRHDSYAKILTSKLFYSVFSYMTDSNQDSSIANFGVYHYRVIDSILSMEDKVRYFPTMAQWVGFSQTSISVEHNLRKEGKSSYTWKRLLRLAVDNMIAFSDKPLRLTIQLGMYVSIVSFIVATFYFMRYLIGGITVSGFTTLILSIWFLSGIIVLILGVMGVYLGRMFNQVKDRPTYIVQKTENLDAN